ncbi:hypothetical protein C789_3227 [Microcystis aeruginosa FACHB-905 = DIANCHI905]|nr:hypothetical protein C789_3227 [Microcystis aeruginosa FACHB-905 = DIANCHI905]
MVSPIHNSHSPHTLHPTPHTLPPGKTFCRKPYLTPVRVKQRGIKPIPWSS